VSHHRPTVWQPPDKDRDRDDEEEHRSQRKHKK
jgi:hypothetical protein